MAFNDPAFGEPKGPWIRCFAWRPTFTYYAGTVFLRRVWKRHIQKHPYLDGGANFWWQYRRFMAAGEEQRELIQRSRQRCLDEVVALIRGEKIASGIGVDVTRAYYLAVLAAGKKETYETNDKTPS